MPERRARCATIEQDVTSFWMLVDRCRVRGACWLWTGYAEKGYGRFYYDERMRFAHDLALQFTTGEERHPDLETCHSCNVPLCCNPAHLRYDTRLSNVADMMAAGTHSPGHRKLTDDEVLLIRHRAALGATGKTLAEQFGVSQSLVTEIIRGRKRISVGGPIRTEHGNRKWGVHAR